MRVFVAGASGVIGHRLVPKLIANGHEVVATTRTPEKIEKLRALGAEAMVVDGLDASAVAEAVARAEPEVVIHQMTALTGAGNLRRFDDEFAVTNELRTRGTDHLLAAAEASGARRFSAQSFTGWASTREGGQVKTEEGPLDPNPPAAQRKTLEAIRYLETAVTNAPSIEGLVLRYGVFYGPGTSIGEGGDVVEMVRRRRLPIIGAGTGIWSFIHVDDAAAATLAAVERGAPGIYNIVDDEPAAVSEWLPYLAECLGAKPPRRVPTWLGRLAAGEVGVSMMTQIRGSSNAKAKRELGWHPRYKSWRDGFRSGLGDTKAALQLERAA